LRALREVSDALSELGTPLLYELLVPATGAQLTSAGKRRMPTTVTCAQAWSLR